MRREKTSVYIITVIVILLLLFDFNAVFAQEDIYIDEVVPNQASPGQEIRLELRGFGFDNLDELTSVHIDRVELPILNYALLSNQRMEVWVFIPEQTPIGEKEIRFIFVETTLEAAFTVTEPGDQGSSPAIHQIDPHEGQADSEMALFLNGQFLFKLGKMVSVTIANMDIPLLEYRVESDQSAVAAIYLPPELLQGQAAIVLFFENYTYEDTFTIIGGGTRPVEPGVPALWGLSPQEGDVDEDIDLHLEGENLFALGDLQRVSINGTDVLVWSYDIESNEVVVIYAYLIEETPLGNQRITITFDNARWEDDFYVNKPSDFIKLIVGGGVVGGGVAIYRWMRKPKPGKKAPKKSIKSRPKFRLEVELDPGEQSLEFKKPPRSLDWNMCFEIESDPGEQTIEWHEE